MLVLTRKIGERLMIGKDIIVQVKRIAGGRVKIGITAPSDVTIRRAEIRREDETCDGKK